MKSKKILVLPILLIAIVGFLIYEFNLLSVQKIEVDISQINCTNEQDIKAQLNLIGKNIITIDEEKIRSDLMKKNICIKEVVIKKQIPYSIKLTISGRVPLARLASFIPAQGLDLGNLESTPSSQAALLDWNFPNLNSSKFFLADENGFVFDENERLDLPALFLTTSQFFLSQQLDSEKFKSFEKVTDKLKNLNEPVIQAKIEDENLLIQSNQKIVFALDRDLFEQLGSLQLILQKAKIDEKMPEVIDLRFDRPVIVYSSNKK